MASDHSPHLHPGARNHVQHRATTYGPGRGPEIFGGHPERHTVRQEQHTRADRLRRTTRAPPPRDVRAGLATDEQVRPRAYRQALLGGCEYVDVAETLAIDAAEEDLRAAHHEIAVQSSRLDSGAQANEGGLPRRPESRRHDHGDEPCRGRPPHARHAAQHQRQVVQGRQLRPGRARGDRLTTRWKTSRTSNRPKPDHRRCLGLFA